MQGFGDIFTVPLGAIRLRLRARVPFCSHSGSCKSPSEGRFKGSSKASFCCIGIRFRVSGSINVGT